MKSVREADVKGKKVLVRADLDVPLEPKSGDGKRIVDDFRLRKCLPTLKYLRENDATVILCGHLDRPGGKVEEDLQLDPVAEYFSEHMGLVHKSDQIIGDAVRETVKDLESCDILVLENLRFDPREKKNDPQFAEELASLADLYVNESFATCHRAHTSIIGVPKILPAYAGLQLEAEIKKLSAVREDPARPLVFIIGGAKVETKAVAVRNLSQYADKILLGGKLMFEKSLEELPNVIFPVDAVDTYDVGAESVEFFKEELEGAGTVVWNGPLGKFEAPRYARGTRIIADFLSGINADIIVGGGDTLAALKQFGLREEMDFVSTGGGSLLEYLVGDTLPGLAVLENSKH